MKITKKLISPLKKSDEEAFNKIYNEYHKLLYYIAYSITLNKETAEEVTQDSFIKMMNNINQYQERGKFKQWLTQITRNLAINALTRNKERQTIYDDDYIRSVADSKPNRLTLTLNDLLDEEEAIIVSYKIIFHYRFREIAETLNLSLGTVQSKYYGAIQKLKQYFKEE